MRHSAAVAPELASTSYASMSGGGVLRPRVASPARPRPVAARHRSLSTEPGLGCRSEREPLESWTQSRRCAAAAAAPRHLSHLGLG